MEVKVVCGILLFVFEWTPGEKHRTLGSALDNSGHCEEIEARLPVRGAICPDNVVALLILRV